jgi:hypothetical protein
VFLSGHSSGCLGIKGHTYRERGIVSPVHSRDLVCIEGRREGAEVNMGPKMYGIKVEKHSLSTYWQRIVHFGFLKKMPYEEFSLNKFGLSKRYHKKSLVSSCPFSIYENECFLILK